MNEEEKEIAGIESYLKGELNGKALADMEAKIMNDRAFADKVKDYSLIIQEVKFVGEQDFIKKVSSWENEEATKDPDTRKDVSRHNTKRYLAMAATIAILIVSGTIWLLDQKSHRSNADLFETYFQPYEDVISERSGDAEAKLPLYDAMAAYNQNDFKVAIPLFQTYLKESPDDPAARCYLGIACLGNDDFEAAENNFKALSTQPQSLYLELSQWYLVLTYLKQNNRVFLDRHLEVLINDENHLFHQQANELQMDLN